MVAYIMRAHNWQIQVKVTKLGCGLVPIWQYGVKYGSDTVNMSELTKPGIHAYNIKTAKLMHEKIWLNVDFLHVVKYWSFIQ